MEEILELQRKLADVQATSNLNKLSDRIVVDLIERLLKTTDFRLIFTVDGQEYLTPEHLDIQIKDTIQQKSRVSVIEIPHLLNVGFEKIESRLDLVCNKFPDIYRLDDFLFTGLYIDSICEEINEDLQQKMHIPLIDISSKFMFPVEFIRNMIDRKSGTIIQGVVNGDNLTTLSYIQTMSSKLRGILRASVRPIALSTLVKDYDLEEGLLGDRIDELIKSEAIEGKIQGGMFIPSRFIKNQELIVKNFFKQNDYIEYNMMMKQLMIPKPKDYLKSLFKDSCIFLENVCFNKDSLGAVKEHVESLLEFGWVDLQTILPSVLKDDEIETIIGKYLKLTDTTEMDGTMIFSKDFLDKCAAVFKDRIIDFIYKTPQKLVENKETSTKPNQKQAPGKKGKKGGANDEADTKEEKIFSQEEVIKVLIEQKVIEVSDKDDYLEEKLYKLLLGRIAQLYETIKKERFESKKVGSAEVIQELQKKIEDLTLALQFHIRSVQMIETNFTNLDTSSFYETAFYSSKFLIENILIFICKKYGVNLPPTLFNAKSSDKVGSESKIKDAVENLVWVSINPEARIFKNLELMLSAIDFLPKEVSKNFKDVKELLSKKKVNELVEHLVKNCENFGFKANAALDKKTEKNFYYLQKYLAKETIKQNKFDIRNTYFNCVNLFLLDQAYFFIVPQDEKTICILNKTLIEVTGDPENKKLFAMGLENFSKMIDKVNEDIYLTNVKEMESLVDKLLMILKA